MSNKVDAAFGGPVCLPEVPEAQPSSPPPAVQKANPSSREQVAAWRGTPDSAPPPRAPEQEQGLTAGWFQSFGAGVNKLIDKGVQSFDDTLRANLQSMKKGDSDRFELSTNFLVAGLGTSGKGAIEVSREDDGDRAKFEATPQLVGSIKAMGIKVSEGATGKLELRFKSEAEVIEATHIFAGAAGKGVLAGNGAATAELLSHREFFSRHFASQELSAEVGASFSKKLELGVSELEGALKGKVTTGWKLERDAKGNEFLVSKSTVKLEAEGSWEPKAMSELVLRASRGTFNPKEALRFQQLNVANEGKLTVETRYPLDPSLSNFEVAKKAQSTLSLKADYKAGQSAREEGVEVELKFKGSSVELGHAAMLLGAGQAASGIATLRGEVEVEVERYSNEGGGAAFATPFQALSPFSLGAEARATRKQIDPERSATFKTSAQEIAGALLELMPKPAKARPAGVKVPRENVGHAI